MTWSLGGVARQDLSDGCVMMDTRREEVLSGTVGVSTTCLTRLLHQYLL